MWGSAGFVRIYGHMIHRRPTDTAVAIGCLYRDRREGYRHGGRQAVRKRQQCPPRTVDRAGHPRPRHALPDCPTLFGTLVGKGLLSLWDILVEWHRCCPLHRGINARCYPPPGVQRTAPRCPTPATDGSRRLPFNRQGRCLPSLYSTNQITAKSVFAITPELQLRQPRTWLSGNTLIALQS